MKRDKLRNKLRAIATFQRDEPLKIFTEDAKIVENKKKKKKKTQKLSL